MKNIYQETCGQEAVRTILSIVNKSQGYNCLQINNSCQTFFDIQEVLKDHNLETDAIEANIDDIAKKEYPIVAQQMIDDKGHFVVITKVSKFNVHYIDGQLGEQTMKKTKFVDTITNKFIVVKTKPEKRSKMQTPLFVKQSELVILALFSLLEVIGSLMLFASLDSKRIILLSLGIIILVGSLLGHLFYVFHLNKVIDRDVVFEYFNLENYQMTLKEITRLKSSALLTINSFLLTSSTILTLTITQGIKELGDLLSIFVLVMVMVVLKVIVKPYQKAAFIKSLNDERIMMFKLKNKDQTYANHYSSATKNSLNYAVLKYLPFLICTTIVVGIIIYQTVISDGENLTSALFYSTYYIAILTLFERLIAKSDTLFEYQRRLRYIDQNLFQLIYRPKVAK